MTTSPNSTEHPCKIKTAASLQVFALTVQLSSNNISCTAMICFFFFPGFAINLSVHDYIHVQRHELETERSIRWAQQIAEGVVVMSL